MQNSILKPLPQAAQVACLVISFLIVAFGQPAWISWLGSLAAILGYALFFRVLMDIPTAKKRFWLATAWYACVQAIQLSWLLSHPFIYIYFVFPIFTFLLGLQFGLLSFLLPTHNPTFTRVLSVSGVWVLLEWVRLFVFSGYSLNPAGLALSGNVYSLQMASLAGVFGMTFWVLFVNLIGLKAWFSRKWIPVWIFSAILPYLFGWAHLVYHQEKFENHRAEPLEVVLVQPAFPIEETLGFRNIHEAIDFVVTEWHQILSVLKPHQNKPLDLIALPEYVVPYGTYWHIFRAEEVIDTYKRIFGESSLGALPPLEEPLARQIETTEGRAWMVSNAYWVQGIANLFNTEVVVGLEDSERNESDIVENYNAALYFTPYSKETQRYEKRVLLPLGEYMPFEWCKELAARYGVQGSFTPGKEAKVIEAVCAPMGISICYEETHGNLMRESRQKGAEMLVNLTSDVWYPNSKLTQQHWDHARLRTVENGIPLIRACNTGITGAIDSLGRTVGTLGDDPVKYEWVSDSVHLSVPVYHYQTLYTQTGDSAIIALSAICALLVCLEFKRRRH